MTYRYLFLSFFASLSALLFTPHSAPAGGLQESIDNAAVILKDFQDAGRPFVPKRAFNRAKGVLIMKISKGGLGISVTVGDGVLLSRTINGWSAPCAISTSGAGIGFQGGGSVTEAVFLLMTDDAVTQFSRDSKVKFTGNMEAKAGPNEREVTADYNFDAPVYIYSRVDGAFGGISVQGRVFAVERKQNMYFYGKPVTPLELLSGKIQPPRGANVLLGLLKRY